MQRNVENRQPNEGRGNASRPSRADKLNMRIVNIKPDANPARVEAILGIPVDENAIGFGPVTVGELSSSSSYPRPRNVPDIIVSQQHESHVGTNLVSPIGPISASEHLDAGEVLDEDTLRKVRRGPLPKVHTNPDSADYDM